MSRTFRRIMPNFYYLNQDEDGNPVQIKCYEHSHNFDDLESLGSKMRDCPNFANFGCFTSKFKARNQDDWYPVLAVDQGCSMFEPEEREETCADLGSTGRLSVIKIKIVIFEECALM